MFTTLVLQLLLLAATLSLSPQLANSDPAQDKQALLAFLSATPHSTRVTWDPSNPTCSWVGVTCDQAQTSVTALRLPGVGLTGPIRPNTLSNLTGLRVLSLRSNSLTGPIPDLSGLKVLRSLYLQGNSFSGELPTSLAELTRLGRLDLSSNRFSGSVPFSLNNLTRLTGLFLENNNFSGNLPSISQPSLIEFNVSNNNLNGSVPAAMSRFPATAFAGNLDLCGGPLKPCSPFFPAPTPAPEAPPSPEGGKKRRKGLSAAAIAGIAVGAAALLGLLALVLICCLRRSKKGQAAKTPKNGPPPTTSRAIAEAGTSSSVDISAEGGADRNKLIFFENGGYSFDLEDLLRASAEVLGKGSVGTSYKAVLEEGTTVVVKRLKDVAVEKREFETVMGFLGKVRNENVVPFRAYYFSKDEKLLVCDFMPAGSLSALLHGSRGSGRTPLDWENRIRIALSTARGLAHLHSSNVIHGNIKASNILLRSNHEACLSDFGLNLIFGSSTPPNRVAGYRAPEVIETRKVTFKADVYSFGVLVLELLTGKSPNQASLGEEGIDLPRWVQSVVREEWTAEVFDVELMRYNNIEEEMVQLLQIGMACVSVTPDQRPSMSEAVRMIEDINRGETDDGLRQSSDDPSKGSDGQTPPQRRSPPAVTS